MPRCSYHNPSSCSAGLPVVSMVFGKNKLFEKLAPSIGISFALVPIEYEPVLPDIISVEKEVFRGRGDPISHLFTRSTS